MKWHVSEDQLAGYMAIKYPSLHSRSKFLDVKRGASSSNLAIPYLSKDQHQSITIIIEDYGKDQESRKTDISYVTFSSR